MGAKYFDKDTGEISYEPEFAKVYINDLCRVKGLNSVKHEMFKFMIQNMNHENVVSYGSITKKKFLDQHGIKSQTFNNNIKGLIDSDLIERI
ncbi:replication/maintenance protein RepL, partial [Vibrio sp. 10N.261.46.A3]|uniref:replication/maintenance protein RepL n=1 Tax=Vibrio sp. 10N.261.46.A3 TaxID=3229658 RepID=UPI00355066BA